MANSTVVAEPGSVTRLHEASGRGGAATGGVGFDWLMAGLGSWLLGGLYLDGWAHIHVPSLETFFTPWHAVLYSGYLAGAAALVATFYRNRRRGASRSSALPVGYRLSLIGAFVFFFAGMADMLWHVIFGIEDGIEGLISPSHLALAFGGALMVTGPLRAGLHGPAAAGQTWLSRMPMVVSLTLFLSLITFFTEYASPYGTTWVAHAGSSGSHGGAFLYQSVGLAGFLVQPGVLMGLVLYVLRRRPLPLGSLTFLLSGNVALMALIHDKYLDTGPYPLIGAAALAGVTGDVLLAWLRPSPDRPRAFRAVAFAIPAVQYLLYFLAVMLWARVTWSVHLWTGAIVIAGGVGWLLSYLVLAPARITKASLTDPGSRA
jgi:hypothetical protein